MTRLPDIPQLSQSPTDPAFVQNPYEFYDRARAVGPLFHWQDYGMAATGSFAMVSAILRDRRFGRALPPGTRVERPAHQADFWAAEDHSMLELEGPRHTRLRGLVLRAFTSRRIAGLAPQIEALCDELLAARPGDRFDLIGTFAGRLPVIVIARLLGVPESREADLLNWSHRMVAMYQAGRTTEIENAAAQAAREFSDFLSDYIGFRRARPADDLISELIAAEEDGQKLTQDEMIATCILLLNAGHEATVHTIGNGVKALLESGADRACLAPENIDATVEEVLRFDTPLHLFSRHVYEDVELGGVILPAGSQIACLLGAANRDPMRWDEPNRFDPRRPVQTNAAFGAGAHFCIGAPLARLELRIALPALFRALPGLRIAAPPVYAPSYHFHGLTSLEVAA